MKLIGTRKAPKPLWMGWRSRRRLSASSFAKPRTSSPLPEAIKVLTKKLEEAEKAKEQVKQDSYNVGVVVTEEAFRAEVSEVCIFYCL